MEILPVIDFKQSRQTVYEMLKDRKYDIDKPMENDVSKLYNIMNFEDSLIVGENKENEFIYVYFILKK